MKLNKDLLDAVMMLSFIALVLIGTSDFDSSSTKNIVMGTVAALSVLTIILRVLEARKRTDKPQHH